MKTIKDQTPLGLGTSGARLALTSKLTLATLCAAGVFRAWELVGDGVPHRCFYYMERWNLNRSALAGATHRGLRQDLSPQGRVNGSVNAFVAGTPAEQLVRSVGYAMSPPFLRLNPPYEAVAYLRTEQTRSFGFFARENVFCSCLLAETQQLKIKGADCGLGYPLISDPYKQYGAWIIDKVIGRMAAGEVDIVSDAGQLVTP